MVCLLNYVRKPLLGLKDVKSSCKKDPSDNFKKPSKVFKWSKHLCNTKCSSILSHNYFSVLDDELSSNQNNLSADNMVQKFIDTSNAIGKDIKALVPTS